MAARHEGQALDSTAATHPQSYHTDSHIGNGVGRKLQHILLPCGACGNFGPDNGRNAWFTGKKQRQGRQ